MVKYKYFRLGYLIMSQLALNLMINKGDKLTNVALWRVIGTRNQVKVEDTRRILLKEGFAHVFYEKYLWLAPLKEIEESKIESIVQRLFGEKREIIEIEIDNLVDNEHWFSKGIVLIRDALQYALRQKFAGNKDFRVFSRRRIFKNKFVISGMSSGVVVGISLDRIMRIDTNNICICPVVEYECIDNFEKVVEDRFERSKFISRVSNINSKSYRVILNQLIENINPLSVNFSNKKLYFNEWGYKIEHLTEKRDKIMQVSLEGWF